MSYEIKYLTIFTHNNIAGKRQWQCVYSHPTIYAHTKPAVRFGFLTVYLPVKVINGFSLKPHQYLKAKSC